MDLEDIQTNGRFLHTSHNVIFTSQNFSEQNFQNSQLKGKQTWILMQNLVVNKDWITETLTDA